MKSSRAGCCPVSNSPISELKFNCQHWVLDFLLGIVRVTVGGKNHFYATKKDYLSLIQIKMEKLEYHLKASYFPLAFRIYHKK